MVAGGAIWVCEMSDPIYEFAIDGLPENLFLVSEADAPTLRAKARNPGKLWTPSEIRQLKASGATVEEARKIAEAKMLMQAGALLWLRPRKADEKAVENLELFE